MKRREVRVLGLSCSQSQIGSYVLVLSEQKGKVKLPIIIKPYEAQRIALELEGIKGSKPLTHDLFKTMTDSFGIDLQEVYIYALAEGIFYTKLVCSSGMDDIEIESSVGDAVILASLYECPIFVANDVMNSAGVLINDDGTPVSDEEIAEDSESMAEPERRTSVENLERMLQHAIDNEEYEIAAELRDRIVAVKEIQEK